MSADKFLFVVRFLFPEMSQLIQMKTLSVNVFCCERLLCWKITWIQCPLLVCTELFIFSSTRSPHIQARPQFKDLHFLQAALSLWRRGNWFRIYLTNCKLAHCFSMEGLFPQAGQGIKKDRGLQQADSTLHHAQHRQQQKPSEKLRLAIHLDCILHAPSPQVLKKDT